MAILRVSNGDVLTTYADINALIKPVGMEVGSFPYPDSLKDKVAAKTNPLTQDGLDFLFGEVSSSVEGVVRSLDFAYEYRRGAIYTPPKTEGGPSSFSMGGDDQPGVASLEVSAADLAGYTMPHILRAHNLHFCLSSSFIKGIRLSNDLQAVVYVLPGEWQRLDPNCACWVVFPSGGPGGGLSFFETVPGPEGMHETEVLPDLEVLETMKF